MLADRLKIEKGGLAPDVMLSRQTFLNCAPPKNLSGGCDGGDVIDVLKYMKTYGLPDESCLTYNATDSTKWGADITACPLGGFCTNCMPIHDVDTCWAVRTPILYRTASYGKVGKKGAPPRANARAMAAEVYARGPIVCSVATPDDFTYGYRGGVYADPYNYTRDDVDHDVEVVGWGETKRGGPFWVVRNSWGSFWVSGLFYLFIYFFFCVRARARARERVCVCFVRLFCGGGARAGWQRVNEKGGGFPGRPCHASPSSPIQPVPPPSLPLTCQGENGFFRIPRGNNSLFIEDGDCWAATVDWSMERDVRAGKLVGTMWGVVPADDVGADAAAAHAVPPVWQE